MNDPYVFSDILLGNWRKGMFFSLSRGPAEVGSWAGGMKKGFRKIDEKAVSSGPGKEMA